MDNHQFIHQPLLSTTTTTTNISINHKYSLIKFLALDFNFTFRILFISLVSIISIWANYEASKGFEVTIINDVHLSNKASQRFNLLYVSNDKATRIILNASAFAEKILYSTNNYKIEKRNKVKHVTLHLTSHNFTKLVRLKSGHYVIYLSPSIMEHKNVDYAMMSTIQRAMARIWVWDENCMWLADVMAEYITMIAGLSDGSGILPTISSERSSCWGEDRQLIDMR
ncbi:hypothetical protein ACFE04_026387 [Oxalis oulophora]